MVSNQGDKPLRFALELKRWTQDEHGQETYTDAPDELIFFPRQFEIAPQQKQIIRLGRKLAATAQERAYRLYINEQPNTPSEETQGQVAMVVSFGVPVFVRPSPRLVQLKSSVIEVGQQQLRFELHNNGNTTQRLTRVRIGHDGDEINQFDQWYLHPGVRRNYQLPLPASACSHNQAQQIVIETDQQTLSQSISIPASACRP